MFCFRLHAKSFPKSFEKFSLTSLMSATTCGLTVANLNLYSHPSYIGCLLGISICSSYFKKLTKPKISSSFFIFPPTPHALLFCSHPWFILPSFQTQTLERLWQVVKFLHLMDFGARLTGYELCHLSAVWSWKISF